MIAQDEEERISRALESVAGWVQQMVVVDGGSRDGPARLAESFGAEVVERPFDGDFSTQRNVAVRALSTPWVLSLDADEVVSAGLPSLLDHIAASGDVDGVWIPFLNLLDDDPVPWLWPDRKLRFFRSGHHYVNRIHERVAGLGRLAWLPMNGPSIRHHKTLEQQWDRERQYFEMDPSWYSPADAERIRRRIERMDDGSPPGQ